VVTAECFMRLAILRRVRKKPDFAPCAVPGAAPLRVILMMQVLSVDAMYPWLAGFCATANNSDRVVTNNGEGDLVCRGLKRVTLTYPMK